MNKMWKWLIAMAFGIPAVGYAYHCYYGKISKKSFINKPKEINDEKEIEQVNECAEEKPKEEGPLERATSLKNSGNAFFRQRSFNEALRCYTEAIELCPKEQKDLLATLYQNRAASQEELKNIEEVIKDCDQAIKLKNNYMKALTRRYKNLEKLGELRAALEDVTACCILHGNPNANNIDTFAAADRILKALGAEEAKKFQQSRKPTMPSKHFVKAYFKAYKHDPILLSLNEQNEATEDDPTLNKGIKAAKIALREERYEDILEHCNEEISNPIHNKESPSKEYLEALLLRATMYGLTSQIHRIMEDLNFIINAKPEDVKLTVNALLKRACAYVNLEDPEKALNDFNLARNLDPNNSDAAHQKAQILLLCEKLPEAIEEFERAIALNPKCSQSVVQKHYAEYRKAVEERNISKVNAAKNSLKKAVAKYPQCSEGYMLLAQVYADSQEFDEAEGMFLQGSKADPCNATLLVHLGLLYLQWKGDVENATKYIEKALEVDPKCEFAYETLASLEVQKGNIIKSISLLDKALALSKSEKEASHILSLKAAVQTQHSVSASLGISFNKN